MGMHDTFAPRSGIRTPLCSYGGVYSEVMEMRRIAILVGVIVFGTSVAASATAVTLDQWRQFFANKDTYSQGFRAGFAAGIADVANAAYGNPGIITYNMQQCTQRLALPRLVQLSDAALQQWLGGKGPRGAAAVQILGAYNACSATPGRDAGDGQK